MTDAEEPEHRAKKSTSFLSDSGYNTLRFMAVIAFPALASLYFGLAQIWGLPKAEEVVGSIAVLDTFLGVLLRSARKSYENSEDRFDGAINVENNEEEGYSNVNVQLDPQALADKDEVTVKVNRTE